MKETFRRLCVVAVWLVASFAWFMLAAVLNPKAVEWYHYIVVFVVGVVAHGIVNWIFQKDEDAD